VGTGTIQKKCTFSFDCEVLNSRAHSYLFKVDANRAIKLDLRNVH
jgi:hypothetical protein